MRDFMLIVIWSAHGTMLGINLFMWAQLRGFLRRMPRITSESDLAAYKALVGKQMRLTLAGFALLAAPWVFWLTGRFVLACLSWWDLVLVVAIPWMVNVSLVALLGGPARQAKEIDSASEDLRRSVVATVEVWRKRLLPDW